MSGLFQVTAETPAPYGLLQLADDGSIAFCNVDICNWWEFGETNDHEAEADARRRLAEHLKAHGVDWDGKS